MSIIDKMNLYLELLEMPADMIKSIQSKYIIFVDCVTGVSDKSIIEKNKDTYVVLLSNQMIDFMTFLYESKSLSDENNKLGIIFNKNNNSYIAVIANNLKKSGWNIKDIDSLNDIKVALESWGVDETSNDSMFDINEEDYEDEEEIEEIEDIANKVTEDIFNIDEDDYEGEEESLIDEEISIEDDKESSDGVETSDDFEESIIPDNDNEKSVDLFNHTEEKSFNTRVHSDDEDDTVDLEEDIKYNEKVIRIEREEAKKEKVIGDTIETEEKEEDWQKEEECNPENLEELPGEVDNAVNSILQRVEGVMRNCFELDTAYGVITKNGIMRYHTDKETGKLRIDSPKPQNGLSEMEMLYTSILKAAHIRLTETNDPRIVPNYKNISGRTVINGINTKAMNYYPGQMLKYALGFVNKKRYTTWGKFSEALKVSIKTLLYEFYKREDKNGVNEYYTYRNKIIEIFSNCLLVTYYSSAEIRIRVSLIGLESSFEETCRNILSNISIMSNSNISILPVKGYKDVVDIQIISDLDTALSTPAWDYKALQVKFNNNRVPSLTEEGLPIGIKVNREIVDYKLDPSTRFLTFIAAGSGSGKGVLTLSLTASAIGSGVPLFYVDFKPDMAPVFWELEEKLGVESFIYDCNVEYHKNSQSTGFLLGGTLPKKVEKLLSENACALMYMRALALMCAIADKRSKQPTNDKGLLFVFDEIQSMQRMIMSTVTKVNNLYSENLDDGDSDIRDYCLKLLNWMSNLDDALEKYVNTTGRVSSVYSIFIGQNATAGLWNSIIPTIKIGKKGVQKPFLSRLLTSGTVTKIVGKGTTNSPYGLGGANIDQVELKYVQNYRYFGLYDGAEAKSGSVEIFKPFLTLNSDDIFSRCWLRGMGKMYGLKFGAANTSKEQLINMNQKYIENMQKAFPGDGKYTNEYGVHPGVGLIGLASMYCNGDIERLRESLKSSWDFINEFFRESRLNKKYNSPTSYMYDMSTDAWLSQEELEKYGEDIEEDEEEVNKPVEKSDNTGTGLDTGLKMEDRIKEPKRYQINFDENEENTYNIGGDIEDIGDIEGIEDIGGIGDSDIIIDDGVKTRDKTKVEAENSFNKAVEEFRKRMISSDEGNETYTENPEYAEASQDISFTIPELTGYNEKQDYKIGGKSGRQIFITPSNTSKILGLTKENAVLAILPKYDSTEKFSKGFFKSMKGTDYEFKRRWKCILDAVAGDINRMIIKRLVIFEDAIVFNKKHVATENILFGDEDIRIEDIVNFRETAKMFPNIASIMIDEVILSAAQVELGDPVDGLFRVFKNLNKLVIVQPGCAGTVKSITRKELQDEKAKAVYDEIENRNKMEVTIAGKNPKMSTSRPGEQNKIWKACNNFRSARWKDAKNSVTNKNQKYFKGAFMASISVLALAVGIPFWIGGKVKGMVSGK